jgi:hypothetical protein
MSLSEAMEAVTEKMLMTYWTPTTHAGMTQSVTKVWMIGNCFH